MLQRLKFLAPAIVAVLVTAGAASSVHARPVEATACIAAAAPWRGAVREHSDASGQPFTVATYNLHAGLGGGHGLRARKSEVEKNLSGIAATLAAQRPDVVTLNELDFDSDRSARVDQAAFIAERLQQATGVKYEVARVVGFRRDLPGMRVRMGSAILTRHRIVDEGTCVLEEGKPCFAPKAEHALPVLAVRSLMTRLGGERRAALKVTIDVDGKPVDVIATHLEAFDKDDREAQAAHVIARMVTPGRTTILAGDMNSVPAAFPERGMFPADDRTHDVLTSRRLMDPRLYLLATNADLTPASFATYPSDAPKLPIDDILATTDLLPVRVGVIGGTESDHRGLYTDYRLVDATATRALDVVHARMKEKQATRLIACAASGAKARARQAGFIIDATGLTDAATTADRLSLIEAVLPLNGGAHVERVFESAGRGGPDGVSALLAKLRLDDLRAKLSVAARARLDRLIATVHEGGAARAAGPGLDRSVAGPRTADGESPKASPLEGS